MTLQPQAPAEHDARRTASPALAMSVAEVAQQLLQHADVVAWVKDCDERFLWVNERFAELVGRPAHELAGRRLEQVLAGIHRPGRTAEAQEPARTSHRRVLLDDTPLRVSESLELADGVRQLSGYVFPMVGADGTRMIGGAFKDATEAEGERRRYADTVELYQDLFAHAGVAMAVLDRAGRIVQANQECRRLTERTDAELVGSPFWSVARVDHAPGMRSSLRDLGSGLDRLSTEIVLDRGAGCAVRARVTISRMPQRTGQVAALMTITSPRRERSQIGQELRDIERTILCQVAEGATTAKIAAATHLSRQGVDYNLRTLMERFDAGNRAELVARAYALGVLAPTWPPQLTGAQPVQVTGPGAP